MKIVFIDSYYPRFLGDFFREHPEAVSLSYDKHLRLLMDQFFGTSDFYSYNLQKEGFEARDIVANDEILQRKWAEENGLHLSQSGLMDDLARLPYSYRFLGRPAWMQQTILAQIKKYAPDIIYCQDMTLLEPETLRLMKRFVKLAVAQIASPLPAGKYFQYFDLVVTSFPHFVTRLRKMGKKSEYLKLAFERRVLKKIGAVSRDLQTVFVGSVTPYHRQGTKMLETVAKSAGLDFWGQYTSPGNPFSPLRRAYHGQAWGLDMYRILARAKIVINRHIDVAEDNANNMRLFEATGMGALLISDRKNNLPDLFKVGQEIEDYGSVDELLEKVKYFLADDKRRELIARAGQKRTLADHNYKKRMAELEEILRRYL
ncbi:MAG: hypothetical protein UV73_C0001G0135 [Candidatus Gottesmanbacteria bacterium GW2011_GWA2_43_14]|uniref:Spore protein YkvP/CgeB glycosyl transferase-like domain-containing protein n=1 Tax=Candidatus Gottesmanbacteria bacterium GW2011_GWA2_43_14 TaxID=1618443 RepID=A0A0G1DLW8_9BACT|nr:MAG: hypothetical protein UV73_C0001G0135 [Candidatus Gottesmanbacteria bacterium GW2011_GWA2_43_14]